ncbi:MAG TPA: response regulator SirA [Verrucomicrobia bacterium]|nr:MAG: response regulator SirA [Lentisphaerae bacterium GWF2_57_35]HBA84988.1 response regulator SirA [Verrucomicrobiota bacterium]
MSASACPITQIVKRDGNLVHYDRDRITTAIFKAASSVGGNDRETAEQLSLEVENTLVEAYGAQSIPSVEEIQDIVEATLIKNGHAKTARAYIIYRHARAQERASRQYTFETNDNIPYKKIYEVLRWNMDHKCETVDGLNKIVADGQFAQLVRDSEQRYDEEVALGATRIMERLPEVRIAIIAGPSSSSKTTTTIKVSEKLKSIGMELVAINIDHYFFDLEMHPKDEFGDYDYETPQALDLDLINEHLVDLLAGKCVKTPHYDFKTGSRKLSVHELSLKPNQILLIDSLHGLYGDMTKSIPASKKFKLYIETLGQLRNAEGAFMRWADNRLLRRMIRDSWHRNLQPTQTLTHWHYVRRSELKNIIPFIGAVDYLVNSAMPFELPILKAKLFKYFPEAMERFKDEPKRQDAYLRAKRVFEMLNPMTEVADDSVVSSRSLLREFIGGSEYQY